MAKKKTRVLWLVTYMAGMDYGLCYKEPKWNSDNKWWDVVSFYDFCGKEFEKIFPSLKLRKNTKCKLRLTQLKNGIKLEKVK